MHAFALCANRAKQPHRHTHQCLGALPRAHLVFGGALVHQVNHLLTLHELRDAVSHDHQVAVLRDKAVHQHLGLHTRNTEGRLMIKNMENSVPSHDWRAVGCCCLCEYLVT